MKILTNKQIQDIKDYAFFQGLLEACNELREKITEQIGVSIIESYDGNTDIFMNFIAELLADLVDTGVLEMDDGVEITSHLSEISKALKPKNKLKKTKTKTKTKGKR